MDISRHFMLLLMATPVSAQSVDTLQRLDSLFGRFGIAGPGCVIATRRDGAPARVRAYGMASLEYSIANTPETIFNAASIAKQFTAAAIVRLAEQGKLSLDDSVRRWVPELPPGYSPVTIRQLMHHTSGVRDVWELLWLAGGRDDDPTDDDDVLAVITRQQGLNFTPGTQQLYSNTNYVLLALIVNRASGQSLKDFAARELFEPAGMTRTFYRDSRFMVVRNGATGYRGLIGGQWGHAPYVSDVYGPGNLFTTAEDLVRWYDRAFTSPAFSAIAREALLWGRLANGDSVPYGAGTELGTNRGLRYVGHGGNDNGVSAYAMRFLDKAFSIAVTCNGREIDAYGLARQAAAVFLPPVETRAATNAPPARAGIHLSPEQLQPYVGIYLNPLTLATREVAMRDNRLVWARGLGTPLDAVAPDRFIFPGQPAELYFPPVRPGGDQEMQLISGGVTIYRKAAPFDMPAAGLRDYAGEYSSDEVGVTLTIAPFDSTLMISTPGSWNFRAQPVLRDTFALPDVVLLRFTRDRRGRVDGMVVDMSRSRGMRFVRRG